MKYLNPKRGEWVQPTPNGYKMACCDCGLVHVLDFRVIKYGGNKTKVQFRVFRDNRSTGQMRRKWESIIIKRPVLEGVRMKNVDDLSKCCNAEIAVSGLGLTHWYICKKCQQACDRKPHD